MVTEVIPAAALVQEMADGHLRGCALVLRLMKRVMHMKDRSPVEVEAFFASQTGIAERTIARTVEQATGKPLALMERWNDKDKTKELAPFLTCDKQELWRTCQFLASVIDNHRGGTTWYPDGWREAYELAARGRTATAAE